MTLKTISAIIAENLTVLCGSSPKTFFFTFIEFEFCLHVHFYRVTKFMCETFNEYMFLFLPPNHVQSKVLLIQIYIFISAFVLTFSFFSSANDNSFCYNSISFYAGICLRALQMPHLLSLRKGDLFFLFKKSKGFKMVYSQVPQRQNTLLFTASRVSGSWFYLVKFPVWTGS